ncbi:Uncharacterized protein GBIM_13887 [Gryllus bimaculatus]|nr:Uncharacterized protein GBIM_13887 [Gryllus bimaculatus]
MAGVGAGGARAGGARVWRRARRDGRQPDDALSAGLRLALGAYQQCAASDDTLSCLKLRAVRSMDGALRRGRIPLAPGLALVPSEGGGGDGARAMGEGGDAPPQEVDEAQLPAEPEARRRALDDLLADRVGRFLTARSLQLDAPGALLDQGLLEEGRKKGGYGGGGGGGMKKHGGLMMMALMMKSGLMAMAFKGVALLAGKALLVAKIALVLAAVVGLSKLLGGGGEEKTTYEIVKHPHVSHAYTHSSSHEFVGGHGGGGGGGHYDTSGGGGGGGHGWGRSMDSPYPHVLAYRGQLPEAVAQAAPAPNTTA